MCGRYVSAASSDVLARHLDVDEVAVGDLPPSWNVAPTDPVYAVIERRPDGDDAGAIERPPGRHGPRVLGSLRWGLVPSWAADPSVASRMINARAETVARKFRAAFDRRRCLIPADGFYEWVREPDGSRQAWYIRRADGAPMVFAGLWETWRPPEGEALRTCTIITTRANDAVAAVHDRMPVMLAPDAWGEWLDRGAHGTGELAALLAPSDPRELELVPVGREVNNVRNNGPHLVEPVSPSV